MNSQTCYLLDKKCVPCEGGMPPLTKEQIDPLMKEVPGWTLHDDKKISKQFKFKNFKEALAFVNKIGALAESEGHHPDLNLHGWNKVTITLSTHSIGGLSENDFIMAAKIDRL